MTDLNAKYDVSQKELFRLGVEIDAISDITIEVPFELLKDYGLIGSSGQRKLLSSQTTFDVSKLANELISFYQASEKTRFDPFEEKYSYVLKFIDKLIHQIYSSYEVLNKRDIKLTIDYLPLRINISRSIAGDFISVRLHWEQTPKLEELILPFGMYEMLTNNTPAKGGLYLFAAENGQGKSTTMGATLLSLLKKHGSFAVTIEDPCELNLQGFVGEKGRCVQTEISSVRTFEEASSDAARQFHASGDGILLLGEIRDSTSADMAIRFANRGIKVLSSVHARSVPEVMSMILNYVSSAPGNNLTIARESMANSLRFISCQELVKHNGQGQWAKRKIKSSMFYNPHGQDNTAVKGGLSDEGLAGINQIIEEQEYKLKKAKNTYLSSLGGDSLSITGSQAINNLNEKQLIARSDAYKLQFFQKLNN